MNIERVIVGIRELEAERTEYRKKLEAIKENLTHMIGILDKDLIHANTIIKIEYAKELLKILEDQSSGETPT